jgi:hypothetical protein
MSLSSLFRNAALALFIFLDACAVAFAQQGLPPGYRLLTDPQVSGGVLVTQRPAQVATPLLSHALGEVTPFFDRRPGVFSAFADIQDQRAEAGFQGTIQRAPVHGVAFVRVLSGVGTVGFAFDSPQTVGQTLPRLLQLAMPLFGTSGPDPTSNLNWRIERFPDGSGQMELPAGWQYTFAQKGMVAAMGPQGIIERAVATRVMSRAGAAQMAAMYPTLPWPGPVLDPTDAVSAFVEFRNQTAAGLARRTGQQPDRLLRVIDAAPVALQAPGLAQAAYIHYELQRAGGVWRGLSLVILGSIMSDGSWLFYETYVASPAQSFAQNLPVLVRIWNSALTAQHVIQERLDNALNSLREAGEIWRQTTQNRQQAEQRMADNWTEAFRGTRVVEDTRTGTRAHVPLGDSAEIVERLNRHSPGRYREIPLRDLNR